MMVASVVAATAVSSVKWLGKTHDFGAFDENDGKVTCQFSFVNDGDEPVTVVSARATCGCTVPSFPRQPVNPGDTASVSVTYDPTGRPGRFEKKVYVDLSTDEGRRATLLIKGVVIGSSNTLRSRYPVEAGELKLRTTVIPFGDIAKGRAKAAFLEVYNSTPDTLTPRWIGLPSYLNAASAVPAIPPGEQTSYALTLSTAATDDLYGVVTDSVYLKSSDSSDPVKIDIVAMIVEDFSRMTPGQRAAAPVIEVSTGSVDFGSFNPKAGKISRSFTIGNSGKDPLLLRRVYTTDPGVTVKADKTKIKSGKTATVVITVDPELLPSELLNARVSIIANDPEQPTTIVRAVGLPNE